MSQTTTRRSRRASQAHIDRFRTARAEIEGSALPMSGGTVPSSLGSPNGVQPSADASPSDPHSYAQPTPGPGTQMPMPDPVPSAQDDRARGLTSRQPGMAPQDQVERPSKKRRLRRRETRAARTERVAQDITERPAWRRRRDSIVLAALTGAWSIAVMFAIGRGGAALGHSWRLEDLAICGVIVMVLSMLLWGWLRGRARPPFGVGLSVLLVAGIMLGCFTWGATHSVVIRGQIYATTSKEARVYQLSHDIRNDLYQLAEYDKLLALDTPKARAHFDSYEPGSKQLDSLSAKYADMDLNKLPDGDFAPIVTDLAASAHFGSLAMTKKRDLLTQEDATTAAEMDTARQTFVEKALDAGPRLGELAHKHHFSLSPNGDRAVE